jgi:hypothetical protein
MLDFYREEKLAITYENNAISFDSGTRNILFPSKAGSSVFCDGGFHEVLLSSLRNAASNGGENSSSMSEKKSHS